MSELDFIVNLKGGMGYPKGILKKAGTDIRKGTFDQAIKYCLNREGLNDNEKQVALHIEEDVQKVENCSKAGYSGEQYILSIKVTTPEGGADSVGLADQVTKYVHTVEKQVGDKQRKFDSLLMQVEAVQKGGYCRSIDDYTDGL